MQDKMNNEGVAMHAATPTLSEKRKSVFASFSTTLFISSVGLWLILQYIKQHDLPAIIVNCIAVCEPFVLLFACIFTIVFGVAIWREFRTPPPNYKILNELDNFLDRNFINKDRCFSISTDRKANCKKIWMRVLDPKITYQDLKEWLETGTQVFSKAQLVRVDEHITRKGKKDGFEIRIWYSSPDDIYKNAEKKVR